MLDHTRRGLLEEIILVTLITLGFMLIVTYNDMHCCPERVGTDWMVSPVVLFLAFFIVRTVRASIVFRNYRFLYLISTVVILAVGLAIATIVQNPTRENIILASIFIAIWIPYFIVISKPQMFRIYSLNIPPDRYIVLSIIISKMQKLTLIIPDNLIKYLETGNKDYLPENVKNKIE